MEAVAAGVNASIIGAVIFAIFIGAINGSIFWARKNGLIIGATVSIVMLLLLTAFIAGYSSIGVMLWGLPPLLLAFLASYTVAIKVKMNIKINATLSSVIAFCITLIASVPYVFTFRVNMFAPIVIAVIACVIIAKLAITSQKCAQK